MNVPDERSHASNSATSPGRAFRGRSERGATLVEAAFVLPVFLLILFGLVDLGVAIGVRQVVTHSAAEGARAAIGAQVVTNLDTNGQYDPTNPQNNAWDRAAAAQALSSSSSVGGQLSPGFPQVAACANDQSHQCITVQVTATSPVNIPVFGWLFSPVQTVSAQVQVK